MDKEDGREDIIGLDICAGTLTRCYAHNWKTVTKQWQRKMDIPFTRSHQMGNRLTIKKRRLWQRFRKGVTDWSKQLLVALAQPVQAPYVHWKERQSTTRLYRQTGLDASGAMLEEHKSHPVERFVVSLCFKQTAILCDSLGEMLFFA